MKVLVISSAENKSLAKKLLVNLDDSINILNVHTFEEYMHNKNATKKSISSFDVIIVLIDDKCSTCFTKKLKTVLLLAEKKGKILIPVQINNAPIINELKHIQSLTLNTESIDNFFRIQEQLEHVFDSTSDNKKDSISTTSNIITLTIAIEAICILFLALFLSGSNHLRNSDLEFLLSIMVWLLAIIIPLISFVSILKRRHQEDKEEKIEFYSRRLKSAIVPTSEIDKTKK